MSNSAPFRDGRGGQQWIGLAVATTAVVAAMSALPSAETPARAAHATVATLQEAPLTQYRAFRRMHVRNDRFNQESWLECWTELSDRGFAYQIVSERGSESLRDKVLRTLLRREQELIASGGSGRADLTDSNYEFTDGGQAADGERHVLLKPRRKDVLLVDGRMILSGDGTEVLRVEGKLAKNPSFWTSLVKIVRGFARINGARVPVYTETEAKVKLAGVSRMEVSYEYESINGRPVSDESRQTLAAVITR